MLRHLSFAAPEFNNLKKHCIGHAHFIFSCPLLLKIFPPLLVCKCKRRSVGYMHAISRAIKSKVGACDVSTNPTRARPGVSVHERFLVRRKTH